MSSLSTVDQVKSAADAPGALFLDVRNDAEVEESRLTSRPYLHVSCTPDDCSELTARADELLPDKNGGYIICNDVFVLPLGEDVLLGLRRIKAPPLFAKKFPRSMHLLLDGSAGDRILQIRSSRGKSEGDIGAAGVYQCIECRWPGGSYK
jgi:hypothetical protein